jgi:hypothetical protein
MAVQGKFNNTFGCLVLGPWMETGNQQKNIFFFINGMFIEN